jgi:hypothetical protein
MNKLEYLQYHAASCNKMHAITKAKNADYTGNSESPFENFTRVEALGITDTTRGFLVRMSDKLSRLSSFAQRGTFSVPDESFEDTCLDLANYAILLSAYVKSKKSSGPNGGGRPVIREVAQNNVKQFNPPTLKGAK